MPVNTHSFKRGSNIIYIFSLLSLVFLITGMFFSRALMSTGMIMAGLLFFNPYQFKNNLGEFLRNKELLCLSAIFLIYLLSGIYSEDNVFLKERLLIKLPFLILPLGFAAFPLLNKRHFYHILYFFLVLSTGSAIWSLIQYIVNYKEITESYLHAKVLPTPINHIRFSLIISLAIFSGWHLLKSKHYFFSVAEKYLISFCIVLLFVFLHILSVRSGLLAFYLTTVILISINIFQSGKVKQNIAILMAFLLLPFMAYFLSPTFQNKIRYSIEDSSRFFKNENVNDYSDGNRLLSWKIGIQVGNTNPLIGAGIGDVKELSFSIYEKMFPSIESENHILPHNQLIFVYAGCGIIGLMIFLFATVFPAIKGYKNQLFAAVNIILISSYISEATIENQLGTCIYLTFFLMTWHYYRNNKEEVVQGKDKLLV